MTRPILPALVLALLLGGCGGPKPDLDPWVADYSLIRSETETFPADSTTQALLTVAGERRARASVLMEEGEDEEAYLSLQLAVAAVRVGLASGATSRELNQAEDCRQREADARRDWEDALSLLERSERAADRRVDGGTREAESLPTAPETPPSPAAYLTAESSHALLRGAPERLLVARDLGVPSSDLESRWRREQATALDPELDPEFQAPHLFLAARAVQELDLRIAGATARERCAAALNASRAYDRYRSEALFGMVELERGLKESMRVELDEERSRMADRQNDLFEALQEFQGKFAQVRQEARGTIMSLGDITFDFVKATLKRDALFNLVRVATILQQFGEMHIYVEGHTDNVGSEAFNQKLSEERAQAVFEFLFEQGVVLERMDWFGYGMAQPVAPNTTADNRAKNRRVDLVIREK